MLPSTLMSAAPQFAPAACSLAAVFIWGTSELAGGIGGFSLAIFYRALAEGKMGLTAPVAALLGAAIPTLADIAIEGAPHAWTFAGFALAIVAIWLITRAEPVRKAAQDSTPRSEKENGDQIGDDQINDDQVDDAQVDDEEKTGAVPKGVAVAALSGVGF